MKTLADTLVFIKLNECRKIIEEASGDAPDSFILFGSEEELDAIESGLRVEAHPQRRI